MHAKDNEETRLDQAMAVLEASDQTDCYAERWTTVSMLFNGLELTGASDDIRQAIEAYGMGCNAIMQPYQASVDSTCDFDEADAAELVELSVQLAERIRNAESDRILARLRHHGGVLPEAEIIEARRHRDWFVPLLLQEC